MNTQTVSLFNKPAGIKHVMYVFRIEIVLGHNELSSMWPYISYEILKITWKQKSLSANITMNEIAY